MTPGKAAKTHEPVVQRQPAPAPAGQEGVSWQPRPYGIELADRSRGGSIVVQRRAEMRGAGDPLEQEADRAAEAALARLPPARGTAAPPPPPGPAAPKLSPAAPGIQRAADPESEAEAAASAALSAEPEVESAPETDEDETEEADEEGEEIQAKLADGALAPTADAVGDVRRGIEVARGGGHALERSVRARMERAFDADFSGVRIHADTPASKLAKSVHALAFTSGRDLFFSQGRYDPSSLGGERLLAHELAHVLQQRAAPMARRDPLAAAEPGDVQRKEAPGERMIGYLYLYDAKDRLISEGTIGETTALRIPAGLYEVVIYRAGNETRLAIRGGETYTFAYLNISDDLLRRAKSIRLVVYDPKEGKDAKKAEKPKVTDPTGQGGTGKESEEEKKKQGQGQKDQEGEDRGEDETKGKDKEKKGEGEEKKGEEEKKGVPGLKGKLGSKYGVFGLLELPQWLISALEKVVDLLGDPEELEAIVELLRAIKEIAENADELKGMFKDSSALLEMALGLRENAAVSAIQTWVESAPKEKTKSKPKLKPRSKGIAKLAGQVARIVAKVRRMLKPVFKVRRGVQAVLGGIGLVLESMETLEHLLEMTGEARAKFSLEEVRATAIQFSNDFAARMKQQLDELPAQLTGAFEQFSESELVTRQALASAVGAAVAMFFKRVPLAKPLIRAVVTELLTHVLPEEAHEAVNDALRSVIKGAKPAFDDAVKDFGKILKELDVGFLGELPEAVLDAVKPSSKTGSRPTRAPAQVASSMLASAGEPLEEGMRVEAETRLGHAFDGVRIHHDAAAAEASEQLGARAFTLGGDVYFGPGRFAPDSGEGRRLLYHELAHVGQQAEEGGVDLRFDYKDLLQKLSKRFSTSVISALKGATASTPQKRKEAEAIKNKASKLVGRLVESRTKPTLPTGYTYIPRKGKKIKNIRRTLAWIRFIPALYIDKKTRRIKLTATKKRFDPKAAARAALRRALGCNGQTQEAHHVIPLELLLHPIVIDAVKHGWNVNGRANGLCISNKIHSGSHGNYTADVRRRLNLLRGAPIDFSKPKNPFFVLVDDLKGELGKRRRKLN